MPIDIKRGNSCFIERIKMRDPYSILGVAKSASDKEIKSAFRKLAKVYHPDKTKDDKTAKAKFNEVSAAYDILSNKEKRAQFDRGEIDAEGNPKFAGFNFNQARQGGARPHSGAQAGAGGFNTEDILREFMSGMGGAGSARQYASSPFGSQAGAHGQNPFASASGAGAKPKDYVATAQVSLEDVNAGASVKVLLPGGKSLAVKLPKNVKDGQQIRLKGEGEQSAFGSGDAIVTVKYKKHKKFRVDGKDLRVDVPITLYEAVLGAKVRVPTLGAAVELNLPAGIDTLKSLRLKGKGLFGKGDILVSLRIVLPKGGDPDLESLMRFWRDQKPYKVRD